MSDHPRRIDIREVAARPEILLDTAERLLITRDGETIGMYLPFPRPDRAAAKRASTAIAATLEKLYEQIGMTEEEFIAEFMRDDPEAGRDS